MNVYIILASIYLAITAVMYPAGTLRAYRESIPRGYPLVRLIKPILLSEAIMLILCMGAAAILLAYEPFDFFKDTFEQVRWPIIYVLASVMVRIVGLLMVGGVLFRRTPSPAEWFRMQRKS